MNFTRKNVSKKHKNQPRRKHNDIFILISSRVCRLYNWNSNRAAITMKKLILITFILLAFNVSAKGKSMQETCAELHQYSIVVMDARQSNISLVKMMELVGDNEILKIIVIEAYKKPLYNYKPHKDTAIAEFANDIYIECAAQFS